MYTLKGNIALSKELDSNDKSLKFRCIALNFGLPWRRLGQLEDLLRNYEPDILMISEIECFQYEISHVNNFFKEWDYIGIGSSVELKTVIEESTKDKIKKGAHSYIIPQGKNNNRNVHSTFIFIKKEIHED
jgi:hypothetical protein